MESVAEVVVRLSRDAKTVGADLMRAAARETGGLPVWRDMGGILVLMPTIEVVQYDPDTRTSLPVNDPTWRRVALVKAALSHPELESLLPEKPAAAVTCHQCGGSGRLFDSVDCGQCMGVGWLEPL
jgi:hypothetical protein